MAQAAPPDLPKRLPLVVQPENRDDSTAKDAKLINAYVEKNAATGEYHLYKRPGLLQTATTIAGVGLGVYNWLGNIYRIQGATIYKNDTIIAGAPNGSLNTGGGGYRWAQCLGGTPALQFGNGGGSYNFDGTPPVTTIAGLNFPTPVKGWAYLDGTTYVMNAAASIRGCAALNTPTDWGDATNAIVAQIEPDGGIATAKQLVYVIAFKQWTTEVFYDALNATGSPLGPVQGAKINYGCASADSIRESDGALLWISTNRDSAYQISMLDNLKHTIVSSKPIERLLGNADLTSVLSFSIKYKGHRFYGVTLVNSNLTLVYDIAENMWAQWTDTAGNYFPIVATTFNTSTGRLILQHATNGKLYSMDAAYFTDDGDPITVDIYTPNFDGGVRFKKYMAWQEYIGDQTPGSTLQVRHNDADYAAGKWSQFRYVDMSRERPRLTDCGTFRRRATNIRHQSNTAMRLEGVELGLMLGTQ